jgi:2'-5' RNA ligase
MDITNDSAMVALLPMTDEWCKIDPPHTTLVYLGKISDLKEELLIELVKSASSLAMISNPVHLKVSGVEVFGEEEKVDVLRLVPNPELLSMRTFLEDWDTGEFPVYKPHATIGPAGGFYTDLPIVLTFDRILVSWGDTRITFWLRRY